jgi:hypothetical protein
MIYSVVSLSVQLGGPPLLLPDAGHTAAPVRIQDPQRGPPLRPQGLPHLQLVPQPPGEFPLAFRFHPSINPLNAESLNVQYARPCGANFTIIKMFHN